MKCTPFLLMTMLLSCIAPLSVRASEPVDLRLVLAADVSRSINDPEFTLQRKGYAAAITDHRVLEAIRAGRRGAILVAFVEWAGAGEEQTVVDWTRIASDEDARTFAIHLQDAPRSFFGRTAIGSAIDYSFRKFATSGAEAERNVIDVSGDGVNNQGLSVEGARDAAVEAGATINGLAIFNKTAAAEGGYLAAHTNPPGGIDGYYRDNVIGGEGAFVLKIEDFNSFEQAMIRKLLTEISSASPLGGRG
jgi:hypothetical protein